MHQQQAAFENIVGKGEIVLFAGEFEEPKIGISGKGLKSFLSQGH